MSATKDLLRARAAAAGAINSVPSVVPQVRGTFTSADLKPEARAERDELRRVLNTLDAGFWDWDIPTSRIWYSDYILTLAGYDPKDVTSAEAFFKSGVHPDEAPDLARTIQSVIDGKTEGFRGEFRYRHKGGHWRWFESSGQAVIRSETGVALRIFGQLTCIDDLMQQQADAAFLVDLLDVLRSTADAVKIEQTSTRMLGEYLGASRARIAHFDALNRKLTVTHEWKTSDEVSMIGQWQIRHAEEALREAIQAQTDYLSHDVAGDPRITDPESIAFYKSLNSAAFVVIPLVIGDELKATFVVSQNTPRNWQPREISLIKEVAARLWETVLRARAQEEQAQTQALLRFALRAAKMSARRLNLDTGEVLLSENFRDMLDDDVANDMPPLDYAARLHPDDQQLVTAAVIGAQTGRRESEHRYIATDGSVRHIAAYIQYDERTDGAVPSPRLASTILRDISKKREAELEAEGARLQLLKHQRLSAMGVMASTLAHELNQPLTVAANYLAMIELGFETRPDQVKDFAARAAEKVLEAGLIIRNVRNYAADGAVSRRPEKLHRLAATALSSVFGIPGQAHSTIVLNDVPDDLTVQVDARMIEHAISNIVRNAVDALADRPEGCIQITAHRAGEMIDLHIADNGPGIDDDIAVNLFSPFITTKEKGTGLGLPLCRTMVEANGGKINLIRHDARGALFSITLPCADTAQPIQQGKAL